MDIAHAPLFELGDGPLAGGAELRGIGETRAIAVGQVVHGIHDLRPTAGAAASETAAAAELGDFDFVDHVEIDPLGSLLSEHQQGNEQDGNCEKSESFSGHKV